MSSQQGSMTVEQAMEQAQQLFRTGQAAEAINLYERIITSLPQYADARGALALVYWDMNRHGDVEYQARAALNIDPNCATAHCALGLLDFHRNRIKEALPQLERAVQSRSDLIAAYNYAGMCSERLGDIDTAMKYYETALRLQPDHIHAHFNRALVWLKRGWYERGWHEYEWRWLTGQVMRPNIPRPRWNGGDLNGKRILVHTEQGIGDTMQFVRFLPLLKSRGAHVVFACVKQMHSLLSRTPGIDDWFPIDEQAQINFELYTPIGSIPGWFGLTERTIPRDIPYVFPDPARVESWQPKIAALGGFKVGLCWQGSKTFIGDVFRSIPLKHYAPLAQVEGVKLVSLQKGYGEEQIAANREQLPITVFDGFDEQGGAMMDTAAVMQHLDLVITSDTAIAHLAGSMGIPVWVALSTAPDWRWQNHRSDSPWYPSMRLFRQKNLGEWDPVFVEMAAALRERISGVMPSTAIPGGPDSSIAVPLAPGELFDKMAILQIKAERITDDAKLAPVHLELTLLGSVQAENYPMAADLAKLTSELKAVNEQLWDIEDEIRNCERSKDFGDKFVELARSVYRTNDRRAAIKRKINELLGTAIAEVKSYAAY